jgi:hypothetical protein
LAMNCFGGMTGSRKRSPGLCAFEIQRRRIRPAH